MKVRKWILVWLPLVLLASPATAAEVVVHDFDAGTTHGWTATGARAPGLTTATPGPSESPGDRYLRVQDVGNIDPADVLRLVAPAELTNRLHTVAATCGTFELDIRLFRDPGQQATFRLDLQVDADGLGPGPPQIAASFVLAQPITTDSGWVHVSVPLALGAPPAGWQMAQGSSPAQWNALLRGANLLVLPLELAGSTFETYGIDNVRLVAGDCPPPEEVCLVPPKNLVSWWPFEELTGARGTVDIAGKVGAVPQGLPESVPGVVGNAFRFDGSGWLKGDDVSLLDFPAGQDFSIDFWIRTDDGSGLSALVEKRDFSGPPKGWQLFLFDGSPGLQLATGNGSSICSFDPAAACTNYVSSIEVADGTWHFVAVTVDRDDPQGIRWYLDGQPVGPPQNPLVRNLDLSNDHELRIAAGTVAGNTLDFLFTGELDEIEVFRRELAADDVQKIHQAGSAGKCDESLVVPWDYSIGCGTIKLEVCNRGSRDVETYDLLFAPLPAGTLAHPDFACSVLGPTEFTMVSPTTPTVQVPRGACVPAEVEARFAAGVPRGYGCYQVTAVPRSGGRVLQRNGSVLAPSQVCATSGRSGVVGLPFSGVGDLSFDAVNLTPQPRLFRFSLDAVDAEMQPDESAVRIGGNEPGVPFEGEVALGPNQTVPIRVPVALEEFETFNPFEVLLRDLDLPEPNVLSSQVVRSVGVGDCLEGPQTLCLAGDRFQVSVAWEDFQGGSGPGQALPLTADTGMFWFFHPANIELVVKVLDARTVNGHFWVFYGALSNVGYTIHVRDTQTGATRSYVNPSGSFGSRGDTAAFPDGGAAGASVVRGEELADAWGSDEGFAGGWGVVQIPDGGERAVAAAHGPCVADATSFCLHDGRFRISSEWQAPQGTSGAGQSIPLTSDTGAFWFFDAANVELVVKIIDGRTVNGHWWVFYGSLSNVAFDVVVDDLERDRTLTLSNPQGQFGSRGETELLDAP